MTLRTKKPVAPPPFTLRPTPEDRKLLEEIGRKLGVSFSQVVRIGLRVLAEKEGIAA